MGWRGAGQGNSLCVLTCLSFVFRDPGGGCGEDTGEDRGEVAASPSMRRISLVLEMAPLTSVTHRRSCCCCAFRSEMSDDACGADASLWLSAGRRRGGERGGGMPAIAKGDGGLVSIGRA